MEDCIFANMLKKISESNLDTIYGRARFVSYKNNQGQFSHAFIYGKVNNQQNVFCRLHSACITSETFFAINCDCREQLIKSFQYCQKKGGIIIYLEQEGRGNGIEAKLKQIELETKRNIDTITAFKKAGYPLDNRTYEDAVYILKDQQVRSIILYTASPKKMEDLQKKGINISKRIYFKLKIKHRQALKNIKAKQRYLGYFSS